jgi:radical SAM superfamily enzyme YgiQ (UPF0313 family)
VDHSLQALEFLLERGIEHAAFYDDALLYRCETLLKPFLRAVQQRKWRVNFHTPNALNARFVSAELADLMIATGFKNLYLGFESAAYDWQRKTGGKVHSHEAVCAVHDLMAAGFTSAQLCAYIIVGHPKHDEQDVENSIRFAHDLGIRVVLSEFSPIPGTPDGELCRAWVDLAEPLSHNKTAFALRRLGKAELNRVKQLAKELNRQLEDGRTDAQKNMPGNFLLASESNRI